MVTSIIDTDTFVLIVGGGPVGLSAAIELNWRGVPYVLVNDNLDTAQHPKCNNTNARSMEHFRRLGIAGELRSEGLPPGSRARQRLCDALLRLRVRPPAAALFGLADAGAAQHGVADRARARPQALRRAGARRADPFRLAAGVVRQDARRRHRRGRERDHRRAQDIARAICSASTARAARCARRSASAWSARTAPPTAPSWAARCCRLHPRADADGGERARADAHDLDHQSDSARR